MWIKKLWNRVFPSQEKQPVFIQDNLVVAQADKIVISQKEELLEVAFWWKNRLVHSFVAPTDLHQGNEVILENLHAEIVIDAV